MNSSDQSYRDPEWCWHSLREDDEPNKFSILAVFEVILAVLIYWSYAFWAHTQTHLLVGAIIVPFLLLRSKQSVELGSRWFKIFDFTLDGTGWLSGWFVRQMRSKEPLSAFFYGPPLVLCIVLGLVAAVMVRVAATVINLRAGIASLSDNWWRTLFGTDIFTRAEIVPGHATEMSVYNFVSRLEGVVPALIADYKAATTRHRSFEIVSAAIGLGIIYFIALGPSYIYRLSIKSTAWIHWPLAYISRPLLYADDPEEVRARLWRDPREWLRRFTMVITLVGAIVASVPSLSSVKSTFPAGALSIIEYAVLIDLRSLFSNPCRIVALIGAAITLALTWYGFELSILVKRSMERADRSSRASAWAGGLEYAMRVRDVCGWAFWGLVLVHAVLWIVPSTTWIGGYPLEILQFVYGAYLPPGLR